MSTAPDSLRVSTAPGSRPTRRRVIGAGAVGAAMGVVAGVGGAYAVDRTPAASPGDEATATSAAGSVVPFRGARQAGIVTPAQDRLHFVSLDVTTTDGARLAAMLREWTTAAERMTRGDQAAPGGVVGGGPHRAPADTGEAYGLAPSRLTITIGFGPSLFDARFGLAERRPAALHDLPAFRGDDLDAARTGGDLCIQACADDPQVAVHAVRNLIRIGFGTVAVRWSQLGFGRTSSTTRAQVTPRNLFGFKDGTTNLRAEDTAALDDHVWVQPSDLTDPSQWMAGGSYLVARRIRMHIETWDRTPLQEQEQIIGRDKGRGAPLGGEAEFDPLDFTRQGADGSPAIAVDAHVRLAHSSQLGGIRILRRGYNFADGTDGLGHLDAGLFFMAYLRDPARQFVPMQRALAAQDRMNEYIEHTGSGVFACPPGLAAGADWSEVLFG